MKWLSSSIQWVVIVFVICLCFFVLLPSDLYFRKNITYHTSVQHILSEGDKHTAEESLTITDRFFTLTVVENINGKLQNVTIVADVINISRASVQLRVRRVDLKEYSGLPSAGLSLDLFFKRQYALQEGAILTYEFLRTPDDNIICYYIHEVGNLRCMNN
jgi:hypothetical protein